jgi:uncharacterized repeat protein (TIGR01451 family)
MKARKGRSSRGLGAIAVASGCAFVLCAAHPALGQPYDASWHTVDGGGGMNAAGGTFVLSGTIGQPDAGGPALGGTFGLHSGFWALAASGTITPQADLGVTKTDGVTSVQPGQPVTYAIIVANAGPSPVVGATVADAPPPILTSVTWTCSASPGSSCPASGAGAINHAVDVAVGGTLSYSMTATLAPNATGTLVNTATVTAPGATPDPSMLNNSATDTDTIVPVATGPEGELIHGTRLRGDLAAVGGAADRDLFRLSQQPHASYEVSVDAASGDVGAGQGPALDRVTADGSTVLQPSQAAGSGPARSLRWMNTTGTVVDTELVRVRSASCTTDCGQDDEYRLRAYETTCSLPRFNNSASQVTVVLLQNPTSEAVQARLSFWSAVGTLLLEHAVTLAPHGSASINTASLPGLGGQGGSVTVIHDAPYGALTGKGVALEPATGFAFDSPLVARPR